MSELQAILNSIAKKPTPFSFATFADWLEERGNADCEAIRKAAKLPSGSRRIMAAWLMVRHFGDSHIPNGFSSVAEHSHVATKGGRRGFFCDQILKEVAPRDWIIVVSVNGSILHSYPFGSQSFIESPLSVLCHWSADLSKDDVLSVTTVPLTSDAVSAVGAIGGITNISCNLQIQPPSEWGSTYMTVQASNPTDSQPWVRHRFDARPQLTPPPKD